MNRIDTINARENMFGVGKSGFHDNADLPGQDATYVSPEWFNTVQEELCNLLELRGITLNPASKRQLYDLLTTQTDLEALADEIETNFIRKSQIVDNLTTDDATKVASAKQAKKLQDDKLDKTDLKDASTEQKGVVKLNNTLTSTSVAEALTANMGRELALGAFGMGQTRKNDTLVLNTTYTNTSSKPWFVSMTAKNTSAGKAADLWLKVNGNTVAASQDVATSTIIGSGVYAALVTIEQIILPGESFIFENNGSGSLECSSEIS